MKRKTILGIWFLNGRTATIKAAKECHLVEIRIEDYVDFLLDEKKKFKQKEISFFICNFFFKYVKHDFFESHYFYHFTYHDIKKGEILFNQNTLADEVFLIKEGEIALTAHYSLDELCTLIDCLATKVRVKIKRMERVDFGND